MSFDLDKWVAENSKGNIVFSFKGELSETMLTDLLQIVEDKLEDIDFSRKVKKKVYNVAIESLQNLFHHSDAIFLNGTKKKTAKYSVMFIKQDNEGFKVTTGNFVTEEKTVFLKKHIEKINSYNRDELKMMYKDILNNQSFSKKGGGGLGLVDIARKSESKIKYNFYSHKNSVSFFDFSIEIKQ
ncbi:MAG: hypothetical protein C0599_07920 [Salinivirgaceae bacterium]|nr:MAG: hypothetical protein C0599_07920 [Salinivirgaceae bacterium]